MAHDINPASHANALPAELGAPAFVDAWKSRALVTGAVFAVIAVILGFLGQALFASRFIIQWFKSEIEGRSVVPLAFWYFSIAGGLISFIYAIHIGSAPFAVGQGSGLLVYARNLYLIFREKARERRGAA